MSIVDKATTVAKEFEVSDKLLNDAVDHFIWSCEHGLRHHTDLGMPMIPTYVTSVPTGKEEGTFLAADLGGTNYRVCSVKLNGDSTFDIVQEKWSVPREYMSGNCADFMEFLAARLEDFLHKHHQEQLAKDNKEADGHFKMGFTFSFPVDQTSMNRGKLIRWTKGFDIKDAVGVDICESFQNAIDAKKLPVHVAALVNDTVGTLMSRAYTKAEGGRTLVGCIFGTGTNGAYSEKISKISKFDATAHPEITDRIMVINTEWGSFDNRLKVIPNTRFDQQLNELTPNPGYHMFEKRISGMFLGELLRLCMVELESDLFSDANIVDKKTAKNLHTPWSLDTAVPSKIDGDDFADLSVTDDIVQDKLGYKTSFEQRRAIQILAKAIGKRSAYLSAVPLAGLVLHTDALRKFEDGKVDIGADGSVVEFYPNFEENIREALRKTKIGSQEERISLGIARDGSGVGAALCAWSVK